MSNGFSEIKTRNSKLKLANQILDTEANMEEKQKDENLHALLIEKIRIDMLIELSNLKKELANYFFC